jgi:predicted alpha/beta-hydrolase family hydrolase
VRSKGAAGECEPLGLLLAPGAGADRNSAALVAIEQAVSGDGVFVSRMDFPYRKAGRRSPDRPPVLEKAVVDEAAALAAVDGLDASRVLLGGRSMGGRICSMVVADGLPAAGLVLVSYPLHPPGRPDRSRTEHLGRIAVPCLFVSGTRDAFGSPAELEAASALIAGPVYLRWIENRDHSLRGAEREVASIVREWILKLPRSSRA